MTVDDTRPSGPNLRVTVTRAEQQGWEVMEERDNRVVRRVNYTDWHRVERRLGLNRDAAVVERAAGKPIID
jgi:hypothetical protein